jgi:hypothetical protein
VGGRKQILEYVNGARLSLSILLRSQLKFQYKDRHCTWNVTLRRVYVTTVVVEKQSVLYICVCVRVCLCARVRSCARECGRVHGRECVHVALLIQHTACMHHVVTSFVAPLAPCFSTLSQKRHDFRKKS